MNIPEINLTLLLEDYALPWAINILIALLIFVVGRMVIGWVHRLLGAVLSRFNVQVILAEFIQQVARVLLYVLLAIAILSQLGFDTTSLVAILAAGSLAVGLALKDSLQNFAAGVMLIVLKPFKVGDFVEVASTTGFVEKVMLFSTLLRATDNREIIIPNGRIYQGTLTNYTARETRRIDMVFGIHYDSDLRKAKQILQDLIAADERILQEPESLVAVSELAESSVNFTVRVWVNTEDFWKVRFNFIESVKLAFDDQGVVIPFPQVEMHIQSTPKTDKD